MFWLLLVLITLFVVAALLLVLFWPRAEAQDASDYDIEVYRSQLREVEQAVGAKQLSDGEAGAARAEIARRILAADRRRSAGGGPSGGPGGRPIGKQLLGVVTAAAIALAVPGSAFLLYLELGSPGQPDQPLAQRSVEPTLHEAGGATAGDMESAIAGLRRRLEQSPGSLDDWQLLARSLVSQGRYGEAAEAFQAAVKLAPGNSQIQADLGEVLSLAADGIVTPAAKTAFAESRRLDPGHPKAIYYQALALLQQGEAQQALDAWTELARVSPADAPWLQAVVGRIRQARQALGLDPESEIPLATAPAQGPAQGDVPAPSESAGQPGPTAEDVAAARSMAPEDRQAMIETMVARLAERLEEEPDDINGWLMLARSYNNLGRAEDERDALAKAVELDPNNPEVLDSYGRAIRVAAGNRQTPKSVAVMRDLLALDERNMQALWFLGLAEARDGRKDQAHELFERVLAQVPADSPDRADLEARIKALLEEN